MMEFHISREARERYHFDEVLFSFSGNVVFANLAASRKFANKMNDVRNVKTHPEQVVHAGALYAMGLIDEASHLLIKRYREEMDPGVMTDALEFFSKKVTSKELHKMLLKFVEEFPGESVHRGEETPKQWLAGATDGTPHNAVALEEMMLLWMANRNDAFKPFEELFADESLATQTAYKNVVENLPAYFATRPLVPLDDSKPTTLFELLRSPAICAPKSLREQLDIIRMKWKRLLGPDIDRLLLLAGEVLHEEDIAIWTIFNPPNNEANVAAMSAAKKAAEKAERQRRESGQQQWPSIIAHSEIPNFDESAQEHERFSADVAWMPTTVLIAKSTYVWLAQLTKRYGRSIDRLDQVPDEELDTLARRGMNSLWLIGVWERSRASKTIKQLCGNADAVASAYSLFSYDIAEDLGGEAAYINLRDRAYARGVRLASDMVPNHMGIDSPWVVEHPDWFIGRWDKPYSAYSFNGPDLSEDPRVEIKIEDHYFDQSDAAVVFQRRDRSSGETRYIYHGNDGTSFPWNDTAQLDYLNSAVREQVIQTILHVARLFPVIRFDAAMTLAKRHFHRLWFPGPDSSGAIPSRAEYGMSNAEFNKHMPQEFWREVVDRVAAEVPGTLLLAEAFWLMEGYFVRTLGMHRVYNSAFMNMLRDEENAKYRMVLKNTLEFDPDIMKRYVNFMSNPDERTAIDQFGDGDKCFGVAAVMATLPGLPMFGHGQVEGYTEKYGMEYRRPRHDEIANHWLVERHEREIAPLLHRRQLFAESNNFLLYDFFTENGAVDENVLAYSNRHNGDRALVLYNNSYTTTCGTIDWSAAYADKSSGQLRRLRLFEGLGLSHDPTVTLAFRDSLTGLEYLRHGWQVAEQGLRVELNTYQCHVYVDWRELHSSGEMQWGRLCEHLNGRGVPNLDDALISLTLRPTHDALRGLLHTSVLGKLADLPSLKNAITGMATRVNFNQAKEEFIELAWHLTAEFFHEAQLANEEHNGSPLNDLVLDKPAMEIAPSTISEKFRRHMIALLELPSLENYFRKPSTKAVRNLVPGLDNKLTPTAIWAPVLSWCVITLLGEQLDAKYAHTAALIQYERLRLRGALANIFMGLGYEGDEGWRAAARIKVGLLQAKLENEAPKDEEQTVLGIPEALWEDPDLRWLTGLHNAGGKNYFIKEQYEELLWWLHLPVLCNLAGRERFDQADIADLSKWIDTTMAQAHAAGYCLDVLLRTEDEKEGLLVTKEVSRDSATVNNEQQEDIQEISIVKEISTIKMTSET